MGSPHARAERARQALCRNMTSLEAPLVIPGDERDRIGRRQRHALDDQLGEPGGQIASAVLLPASHERPRAVVVDERRPCLCEGQSTPDALGAPFDRPGPRCAATGAAGRPDPNEQPATSFAQRPLRQPADTAARGQQDRERHHPPTVGLDLSRNRAGFVPGL